MTAKLTFILLAFLLFCSAIAHADGKFKSQVLAATNPTIPQQAGVIAYRDGVETLIVASTAADVLSNEVAWIVPLPSVPTEVAKVRPGTTDVARTTLGPRIEADSMGNFWLVAIGIYFLIFSLWLGDAILSNRKILRPLIWGILFCWLPGIFVPNFLSAGMAPSLAESVAHFSAGNYEVNILSAIDAKEVNNWLKANNFQPLTSEELAIVSDYIREGWVFAVARLAGGNEREFQPHPLKFVFSCAKPVFPMRLTAAPGEKTEVHLITIGSTAYLLPGFETIRRDRFDLLPAKQEEWSVNPSGTIARASNGRVTIAHSDILLLIEDNDWICHLSGVLDAKAMGKDLYPAGITSAAPRVKVYYSKEMVLNLAIGTMLLAFSALFIASSVAGRLDSKLIRPSLLIAIALSVGIGVGVYRSHPIVEQLQLRTVPRQGILRVLQHEADRFKTAADLEKALTEQLLRYGYARAEGGPFTFQFISADDEARILSIEESDGKLLQIPLSALGRSATAART